MSACLAAVVTLPMRLHYREDKMKYLGLGLTVAASLVMAAPAFAASQAFKAPLTAQAEVPPNASGGNGVLEATYDPATKMFSWKGSYSGLSGPATAAHFHGPAETGANAGVAVPVEAKASPFSGSATLTDAQAADLTAGKWYFNVHTEKNKGGEIRGQLAGTATK